MPSQDQDLMEQVFDAIDLKRIGGVIKMRDLEDSLKKHKIAAETIELIRSDLCFADCELNSEIVDKILDICKRKIRKRLKKISKLCETIMDNAADLDGDL